MHFTIGLFSYVYVSIENMYVHLLRSSEENITAVVSLSLTGKRTSCAHIDLRILKLTLRLPVETIDTLTNLLKKKEKVEKTDE